MFELQASCIVLEIANVRAIIHRKQDDDDTDREEISDNDSEDRGESTMSFDIKENDLDNQLEVIHPDQAHHDMIIPTRNVPLKKHGTVPILSLPTFHFQICDIQPEPWHHHCSNATSQLTYYANLTLYPLTRFRFPRLVETIAFLKQRPVQITMFLNTKLLPLRWRNGS
jgi:hypothetical protein